MTSEQLAELLYGSSNPPVTGEAGVSDQIPEAPLAPVGVPQGNAAPVTVAPNDYNTSVQDFHPVTYDFGNQGAKQMEYDNLGNLVELLPGGVKVKVGQSTSGYSPEKMAQIESGPMGSSKMAKGREAIESRIRSKYAPIVAGMNEANAGQLAAETQMGQAEAAQIMAKAQGQKQISDLMVRHHDDFQRLNESAAIAKQQAKDEYRQRLLEIPTVNPNAMWDEAGPGGQFQMAVAAFVHDMLGVKGIKTSAMDTINGAIRNKIDAQIANINAKRQVAAGFKDLWDMTVQESASQEEAQAKMHGYMLKAMEAGIDANMGAVDANVARAKHQQAKMVIRQAQLKNMAEVESHIEAGIDRAYGNEIQIRGQNIQAAIAKANQENELTIAQLRANAQKAESLGPVIRDTTKSGGGVAKWRIRPELASDKELVRNVITKTVATSQALEGMRELMDLQKQVGTAAPDVIGRLRTEIERRETALRNSIVMALVLDQSGKQVTDKEREYIQKLVPEKDYFTNGTNRRIISQLIEAKGREMNNLLRQTTNDIRPGDPEYGTAGPQEIFGPGEMIDANLTKTGQDEHQTTDLDLALQKTNAPNKFEGTSSTDSDEYKNFTKPYWEDYKKTNRARKTEVSAEGMMRGTAMNAPVAFEGMRELAELAYDGNNDALMHLRLLATNRSEDDADVTKREMADYFLDKLDKVKTPDVNARGEVIMEPGVMPQDYSGFGQ